MTAALTWTRSSFCANGTCVEVARDGDTYLLRDGKTPTADPIRYTAQDWHRFLEAVRAGEYRF